MKSDMMHLRATWSTANSGRSNLPFGEIKESKMEKFYGNNFTKTSTKPSNIGDYSVYGDHLWMPRDQ